jgi:hypothetical protein
MFLPMRIQGVSSQKTCWHRAIKKAAMKQTSQIPERDKSKSEINMEETADK